MTLHIMKQTLYEFLFLRLLLFWSPRRRQSTNSGELDIFLLNMDMQISIPYKLKIAFFKVMNSFGD